MRIKFPSKDAENAALENAKRMGVSLEDYVLMATGHFNDVQAVKRGELPARYIEMTEDINEHLNSKAEESGIEPIVTVDARVLADILKKAGIGVA